MRKIFLSPSEKDQLSQLHRYSKNCVERERSSILLFSDQGYSMKKVSELTGVSYSTVIRLLDAWEGVDPENRFSVLRYAPGQGAKLKLAPLAEQIPVLMNECAGNLNFVLQNIEEKFGIKVCKLTLQNFLKDARLRL